MKKLLSALYAMPGPVWLFGAYGVSRMWSWLLAWAASGSLPTTWTAAVTHLASLIFGVISLIQIGVSLVHTDAYNLQCFLDLFLDACF